MEPDLPPHLDSVRQRLMGSLQLHPTEQAPHLPSGLLEDLDRHFESPVLRPVEQKRPWRERVHQWLASPAFGIGAAAGIVFAFAAPSLLGPNESFRGGTPVAPVGSDTVQIILVQEPSGIRNLVENSGDVEAAAVASVEESALGMSIRGSKVMVDFSTGELRSIDAAGNELYSAPIPRDTAELTTAIAIAVSHL